jgi:hypothetical protein
MKYNTLRTSAVGGMLALAIVATALPAPRAEAATIEQLQAQIQVLLAQLQTLMGNAGGASACSQFTGDLMVGRTGAEVSALQNFLIGRGHTIPAGATGYFGEQTRSALTQFQSAQGIVPAVGYFGPITRAKVNALCTPAVVAPVDPGTGNTGGVTDPVLTGEGWIERFDVKSGDDTNLEENQKNVPVMDVEFRVEHGDIRINRIDVGFTPDDANDEDEPWETFTEVSIYNGNERIARIDASDEDNWKEDSPVQGSYMIRLSGINWVINEGEDVEMSVRLSTARHIDGADDGEVWSIFIPDNGIRGFDADRASIYAGNTADSVTIDIDEAGSADEIIVKRSDEDPKGGTLQLDDNKRSGFMTVFAFDLDTDDSENDIEIRELPVQLTVSTGTVSTFMRDARLVIDGKRYNDVRITDGTTNTMVFEFDRNELVIDAGDRVTVELEVDFKSLASIHEGVTIVGSIDSAHIKAEGADDLEGSQLAGAATGEVHVMRTKGIMGEVVSLKNEVTTSDGPANDYATFSMSIKVTAFGQDVYIPTNVATATAYQLKDSTGSVISASGTPIFYSDAREQGGYFRVSEGETKTFTLDVTYMPGVPMTTARLQLLSLSFSGAAEAPTQVWTAVPAHTYQTQVSTIVN